MNSRNVTLIGAGLVGPLLAIFLARRGFAITIYERRPDLRKANIAAGRSINLALANRGLVALERAGLLNAVRPLLIPMAGRMLHDPEGKLTFLPYGHRPEEVIYSVSRSGLNQLLLDKAEAEGVVIDFQKNCRDVDFDRQSLSLVDEATGEIHDVRVECVLGTDGSASQVRNAVVRATGGRISDEPLGHGYKELTIAPAADGGFRMASGALHIWPRGEFMLIALPNPDGSFTLTLFLPCAGPDSFASLATPDAVNAFFARWFPDARANLPDLTAQFFAHPQGSLGTVRCEPWHYQGKALLLGDAAHAIVPFHGQGMNCGFEDVAALDECLVAPPQPSLDASVFERFYALRKPNAEAIADMALENYVEMRATVRDSKFALKKALSFALEDRFGPHFIPRYSMVMFHTLPYAEAKARGAIQEEILDCLTAGIERLEEVDFVSAEAMVRERL